MFRIERKEPVVVTKEELLNEVSSSVQIQHLLASVEYSIDLMLDMQFKMMDALVTSGAVALTAEEQEAFEKLKGAQGAYHTFTLGDTSFPDGLSVIDYMYHFKSIILQKRTEYFKAKEEFNIQG
jgi:hypothetical protein